MNIDIAISEYIGKVVRGRSYIQKHGNLDDWLVKKAKRELELDTLVLGALRCAKAVGYTGKE